MTDHVEAATSAAAASATSIASKFTFGGSFAVVWGWLVSSEAAVLGGLLIGFAGFLVQWYYRHKEYALKVAEANARAAARGYYESGDA